MKAMLAGFAAIVVIGACSYAVLGQMGFSSQDTYRGDAVRLD